MPNALDLSKGSVIHIEEFKSSGFEAKDKYLVIFGSESLTHVLAFTTTTTDWTKHPYLGREVIEIPRGTVVGLPARCWIKCFDHPIRLDIQQLEWGRRNYTVKHKGKLPPSYLPRIRNVIECSDALIRMDIDDCLAAMDRDLHEKR
jgi:hypothetical protein